MKITVSDLARLCGVSRGTVDRALNGRPGISEKTRTEVLRIARQSGYTPNVLARSLVTGKTNTIGIVVFDVRNRHFSQLIDTIQHHIAAYNYFSYICITEKDPERERQILHDLVSRNVDGVIIIPVNHAQILERILDRNMPIVAVSNRLSACFSYVGSDFRSACYQGMEVFYEKGYRYVSFICPNAIDNNDTNAYAQIQRADGYRAFMKDHPDMHGELITAENYYEAVRDHIRSGISRPGFFCSSDYYALKILMCARRDGFEPPRDFGLMGYDYIDTLDYLEKKLSTISYPIEEIGCAAVRQLHELINGTGSAKEILLDCHIIPGNTL